MKIAIDPGHGGISGGCQYGRLNDRLSEKAYVLELSKMLAAKLREQGHAVGLTRRDDSTHSFADRLAAAADAELLISVHVNANEVPTVHGLMCFHREGDAAAQRLGDAIAGVAPGPLARFHRSIVASVKDWPRCLTVLRLYRCPALLVETGFASNDADRAYLLSDTGKRALVEAIARGVSALAARPAPAPAPAPAAH